MTSVGSLLSLTHSLTAANSSIVRGAIAAAVPVTLAIHSMMEADRAARYSTSPVFEYSSYADYLKRSYRLSASGYWEVMVRGRYGASGVPIPRSVTAFLSELRRLRQIVDEAADFETDLAAGLVTGPIVALRDSGWRPNRIDSAVRATWESRDGGSQDSKTIVQAVLSERVQGAIAHATRQQVARLEQALALVPEVHRSGLSVLSDQRISKAMQILAA